VVARRFVFEEPGMAAVWKGMGSIAKKTHESGGGGRRRAPPGVAETVAGFRFGAGELKTVRFHRHLAGQGQHESFK